MIVFIGVKCLESEQPAEQLRSFGNTILIDAYQCRGISSQNSASNLNVSTTMSFIFDGSSASTDEGCDEALNEGQAISTGISRFDLCGVLFFPMMGVLSTSSIISGVGTFGIGSIEVGMPTVAMPSRWRSALTFGSYIPKSPHRDRMRGVRLGYVQSSRSIAVPTVWTRGMT